MNDLVFIKENKVVTDSLIIAEVFVKRHADVLRDIENQIEKLKEAGEEEWGLRNFAQTQYQHQQNKQFYPKVDMTEDAFALVAMAYVTPEAMKMKVKFLEEFKQMKEHIQNQDRPKSQLELLQLTVNQMVAQDKKINDIEQNIEKLQEDVEKRMTLDYGQQQVMNNAVKRRVYKLWNEGKVDKAVYDSTRKLFPALWRDVKRAYRVNAYANILQKDFDEAMSFIEGWRPIFSGSKSA